MVCILNQTIALVDFSKNRSYLLASNLNIGAQSSAIIIYHQVLLGKLISLHMSVNLFPVRSSLRSHREVLD